MHQENEFGETGETCPRRLEFRFVYASRVAYLPESASGANGELVNVGKCRYSGRAVEDFVNRCLRFGPPAVRYGTHPFLDGDEPIGRDLLKSLVQSIWPIHVDVGRSGAPQTEMQAGIAAREKAGLTQDCLRLCLASIMDKHPSSNGASIGLYTFQFHFDPVGLPAEVIAQ